MSKVYICPQCKREQYGDPASGYWYCMFCRPRCALHPIPAQPAQLLAQKGDSPS
jgi:ribosomal protein L37AE/L43A